MKHIRPYRLTLCFSYYPALERDQQQRADQRNQRHHHPYARRIHRLRTNEMINTGQEQKQRRAGDKHTLRQRGQRFRFTMAKGMFFIGRLQRITHHQQVGQRGGDIHQ